MRNINRDIFLDGKRFFGPTMLKYTNYELEKLP